MSALTAPSSNILSFQPRRPTGYFKLNHSLLESTAWQSLTPAPRALFIEIAGKYRPYNNGDIQFSIRDAKQAIHIGQETAGRAFQELEDRGFIVCSHHGRFDYQSEADRHTKWGLTEFALGTQLGTDGTSPSSATGTDEAVSVPTGGTNRLLDSSIDKKESDSDLSQEGRKQESLPTKTGKTSKPSDSPFSLPALLEAMNGAGTRSGGAYIRPDAPDAMAALAAFERARREQFRRDERGGCLLSRNMWTAFTSWVATQTRGAAS